jgi:cytochrome c peroxidase
MLLGSFWGCQESKSPKKPSPPAAKQSTEPKSVEAPTEEKTEPKPEVKPEPKPEVKPEPKPEVKPEPKPEARPEPKPEAQAATPASEVKVPLGLPPLPTAADNPMTAEKIELGKLLYFDARVSKDGNISCATCHDPKMAWAEHTPASKGFGGHVGQRNSPTVINAAYATSQFWDGRAKTLEEQSVGPVGNPIEMGHSMAAVVEQFNKIPEYQTRFQKVFGTGVTEEGFAKAVAAFERTVLSGNSPYDKFKAGDEKALTDAQKKGMDLFMEDCNTCHKAPLFSNYLFYSAGVGMKKEKPDEGRKVVTGKDRDRGKFRTPPLREVANTAPYFHDGSVATLEDAVALMMAGGADDPDVSPMLKGLREEKFAPEDRKNVVEFLKALSGEYPIIEPPKLP